MANEFGILGYWIYPTFGEGVTPRDTLSGQPAPFQYPISTDCLVSILRACRLIAAGRWHYGGDGFLVKADQAQGNFLHLPSPQ
jgi:hypothetical protein